MRLFHSKSKKVSDRKLLSDILDMLHDAKRTVSISLPIRDNTLQEVLRFLQTKHIIMRPQENDNESPELLLEYRQLQGCEWDKFKEELIREFRPKCKRIRGYIMRHKDIVDKPFVDFVFKVINKFI